MRENLSGVGKILGSTRAVLESGRQRTLNGTLNSGESPVFEPPPDILFFQPISGSDPLKLSISLSFIFLLFHSVSMYLTSYQSSYASRHPTLSASLSLYLFYLNLFTPPIFLIGFSSHARLPLSPSLPFYIRIHAYHTYISCAYCEQFFIFHRLVAACRRCLASRDVTARPTRVFTPNSAFLCRISFEARLRSPYPNFLLAFFGPFSAPISWTLCIYFASPEKNILLSQGVNLPSEKSTQRKTLRQFILVSVAKISSFK